MSDHGDMGHDLPPALDEAEREALAETGARLRAARPTPDPNFRGELRRRLLGAPGAGLSPTSARRLSAAYACFGGLLLAIAAVGLAGAGPFAA